MQQQSTDPKGDKKGKDDQPVERTPQEIKQQQTDPNLTELKGFVDPKESLEPKGTDNPFNE